MKSALALLAHHRLIFVYIICAAFLCGLLVFATPHTFGQPSSAEDLKAFDAHIAPLLAKHCLECHSATTKRGGLDLSNRDAALAGGDSGVAIVADNSGESLLWQHVEADAMPKDRPPLNPEEKHILRSWIDDGAVWGREQIDPLAYTTDRRAGYDWWSLQPVVRPDLPDVKNIAWPRNEIDRFLLARLEAIDLVPAPEADRRTLIRRLSLDLIGLPPEPAAVEEFVSDSAPDAYDRLVDKLLDSPHYGERWARHWLDVVRFGETQGYERNLIRDNAWRYRDYVIDAFNRNLRYDEFVRQQIAGDVLYPGDYDALMATGYHVCGTWDQVAHLEGSSSMRVAARWDHIEDLVGTLGQSFLGLTVNCSRCHDHKFDPISQRDYYEFAAILGGVTQQKDERSIEASRNPDKQKEIEQQLDVVRRELVDFEQQLRQMYEPSDGLRAVEGLEAYYLFDRDNELADRAGVGEPLNLSPGPPAQFATKEPPKRFVAAVKQSGALTVEVWITPANASQTGPARIATLSQDTSQRNFTFGQDGGKFDVRLRTTNTDQNGIPSLASPDGSAKPERTHVVYTFGNDGVSRLYVNAHQVAERDTGGDFTNWDEGYRLLLGDELTGERRWEGEFHVVALYSQALPAETIAKNFETGTKDIRAGSSIAALLEQAADEDRQQHAGLVSRRADLERELATVAFNGAAHVIVPEQPSEFHILARGDPQSPGDAVAPNGLSALTHAGYDSNFELAADAPEAERRVTLAAWLADERNPLTARVFVNRLWHYHFGQGIVDTPSDFGYNGGRPSHAELLDWLASEFVAGNWNIKAMHRLIVTSAAYRQASQIDNERAREIDADNRLLWRFNRRRLDGETLRDTVLAVAGALNPTLGGPSYRDMRVDGGVMGTNSEFTTPTDDFGPEVNRRTIYRLWARSGNNPLLQSLDCPDPSVMAPVRTRTITPVQSLALLNNSLMQRSSERFAERVMGDVGDDVGKQVDRAYRIAFGRSPSEPEASISVSFVKEHGLAPLCLVLFNSNEFFFVN